VSDTAIEWTEKTWNPTTGCDRVSAGCDNCYALTLAKRLKGMGSAKYQNDGDSRTSGPGFGLTVHPDALDIPRHWRKPSVVFVNSMSDLFHAKVPLSFVRDVFDVMRETPRHTYQVLTKRALRLRRVADQLDWPGNVWMGVSVESADHLDRVDDLREVPAAVRFLSCEPLLGSLRGIDLTGIDWLIAGGESGPEARPAEADWIRDLRDWSLAAGTRFFFKQWGETAPLDQLSDHALASWELRNGPGYPPETLCRVGKKAAGRQLDGRTWNDYPAADRPEENP
jgi:protein gp37